MGIMYTINLTPTAFTVAPDLFELTPADDRPLLVHAFRVWQTSDFGDAQEEILTLSWVRGNATSGSGGNAAANAIGKSSRAPTSGFTFESANTTAASAGTAVIPYSTGWNVRGPLEVVFTPEQRILVQQGDALLVLRLGSAPADSLTIGASADVEEF